MLLLLLLFSDTWLTKSRSRSTFAMLLLLLLLFSDMWLTKSRSRTFVMLLLLFIDRLTSQQNVCNRDVCLFVGCVASQQHASVSQGRICSDNFTCCHTEIEVTDQTFYLTQSQYTDTGPTSPSADPISPGAWQSGHWSANL